MARVKTKGSGRTRNYATVVYPESAPDGWLDLLIEECVPSFVSPLHDMDCNPTGEVKKAHYHVLIMFDSVKTIEQAQVIFDEIGGVGCEKVNSIRGYARYLCHLDNPEKAQYEKSLVKSLGGADYRSVIGLPTDKYTIIGEILDFIQKEEVYSYADLLDYARVHKQDWFVCLCDNGTYVVKEYLKSKKWMLSQ